MVKSKICFATTIDTYYVISLIIIELLLKYYNTYISYRLHTLYRTKISYHKLKTLRIQLNLYECKVLSYI